MKFGYIEDGGLKYISYYPWREAGIIHGFLGTSGDFSEKSSGESKSTLLALFGAERLLTSEQVHGDAIWDLRGCKVDDVSKPQQADAIILDRTRENGSSKVVVGVKTADCVPILVSSGEEYLLIHSGWKGLANGIVEKALKHLTLKSGVSVLVGPCAGVSAYQVGKEVVSAIGKSAVYLEKHEGKFHLDLSATALAQVRQVDPSADIHCAKVCTISDVGFHSFRRDGVASGRNLSFFVIN